MKQIILEAKKRETHGKSSAKKIRQSGFVPAVLYGKDMAALSLEIPEKDFSKGLSKYGSNALFNIKVGAEAYITMVTEVQRAPLSKKTFHIDFHKISLDTTVSAMIPIRLEGESKGVKAGGTLEQYLWNLEIEVLPLEIPEHIILDVTSLELDGEFRVKDLTAPKGAKIITSEDEVVVAVKTQREEEAQDLFADTSVEPEVIKKGKEDK